ncbi:hypothetical protein EMCG_01847, partial [[Emmonsia] crescens]
IDYELTSRISIFLMQNIAVSDRVNITDSVRDTVTASDSRVKSFEKNTLSVSSELSTDSVIIALSLLKNLSQ